MHHTSYVLTRLGAGTETILKMKVRHYIKLIAICGLAQSPFRPFATIQHEAIASSCIRGISHWFDHHSPCIITIKHQNNKCHDVVLFVNISFTKNVYNTNLSKYIGSCGVYKYRLVMIFER